MDEPEAEKQEEAGGEKQKEIAPVPGESTKQTDGDQERDIKAQVSAKENGQPKEKSRFKKLCETRFKQFREIKVDRHIELALATAITFFALCQLLVMCSGSGQTEKLIAASRVQACAARSFAKSAELINGGVHDAAAQLSEQAGYSRDMGKQLAVTQRPWVGIDSIEAGGLTRDPSTGRWSETVEFVLKNYGTSVAQRVRFFPSLTTEGDPSLFYKLCEPPALPAPTKYYPGITIFPGNAPPATFNEALHIDKGETDKFINGEKKGHGGHWDLGVFLAIGGCIDYMDGFTPTHHHTGFYYTIASKQFITPDKTSIPASNLNVSPNILNTGTID